MNESNAVSKPQRAAPNFINRETVTAAALSSFAQRGFHGASMRQIANEANTSLSNLYNYFPSKESLLVFVLYNTAKNLADRLERVCEKCLDNPTQALEIAVREYIGFIVEQPKSSVVGITEFRYVTGEYRADVIAQRDRTEILFNRIIDAGVEQHLFFVTDPSLAARAVVTLCNSMSTWYRRDGRLAAEELATAHADLALGLVRSHTRANG